MKKINSTSLTTVRMSASMNRPGNPIASHPGFVIQPSARHHTIAKKAVVVTKPAVMGRA